jgi:hypothetical protein
MALPFTESQETAMLVTPKADFLRLRNLKQAGSFGCVDRTRRASNPYPKVFFVLTSVV